MPFTGSGVPKPSRFGLRSRDSVCPLRDFHVPEYAPSHTGTRKSRVPGAKGPRSASIVHYAMMTPIPTLPAGQVNPVLPAEQPGVGRPAKDAGVPDYPYLPPDAGRALEARETRTKSKRERRGEI